MRKELLWAGIIGISFGLVIGFGVWRVKTSMPKGKPVATATPSQAVGQAKITIDKPGNFDVVVASPMTVSGITKALSWVIISTEKNDYLTQSKEDGTFSLKIEAEPGINNIKASSINSQGGVSSDKIVVVYSSSFQSGTASTATSEASLDESVARKIAQAEKPPKAYIGTVTDIIDSTIQIKSIDSQIQQISTQSQNITVVNSKGSTSKNVKLSDIALGDFIVAMGYINGNDVLNSQRILISNPTTDKQISITMQKAETVSKKSISLTPVEGGETTTLTPGKDVEIQEYSEGKTKDIKLSDIPKSQKLILVSDNSGSPSLSRSIFALNTESE